MNEDRWMKLGKLGAVANVVKMSGCEVADWILQLKKKTNWKGGKKKSASDFASASEMEIAQYVDVIDKKKKKQKRSDEEF